MSGEEAEIAARADIFDDDELDFLVGDQLASPLGNLRSSGPRDGDGQIHSKGRRVSPGAMTLGDWIRAARGDDKETGAGRSVFVTADLLESVGVARGISEACRSAAAPGTQVEVEVRNFALEPSGAKGESVCLERRGGVRGRDEGEIAAPPRSWTVKLIASRKCSGREASLGGIHGERGGGAGQLWKNARDGFGDAGGFDGLPDDLWSLGVVLYEVFKAMNPLGMSDSSDGGVFLSAQNDSITNPPESEPRSDSVAMDRCSLQQSKKREKRTMTDANAQWCLQLRNAGLPQSLCDMLTDLLNPYGQRYQSFRDVEVDLQCMLSDPDRFLFDSNEPNFQCGRLEFPQDKLYGREDQMSILTEVYERALLRSGDGGGSGHAVLVSGYSGVGKTRLVRQAIMENHKLVLKHENGVPFHVSGKFDGSRGHAQPFLAIAAALDQYCNELLQKDEGMIASVRASIETAVGPDIRVLTSLIPSLSKVVGSPEFSTCIVLVDKQTHFRFQFVFRRFVRAIATPSHPLVIFLDDLQNADEASLELIAALLTFAERNSLLFIGSYRTNEVGPDHPLTTQIRCMRDAGVEVTEIELGPLGRDCCNKLISDVLRTFPRLTQPLAEVVCQKTQGNALFLEQFLQSLVDNRMLWFSLPRRSWEWDLDMIQSKCICDGLLDLMLQKMSRLPQHVQFALKVASCLGTTCAKSTLQLLEGIGGDKGRGIISSLAISADEGLLIDTALHGAYKFAHDQIQHAAYFLMEREEQIALHLKIGRRLWEKIQGSAVGAAVADLVVVAAAQCNVGEELITDPSEKLILAQLNLEAAKSAIASYAFLRAQPFVTEGVYLLSMPDWETHYELSLELHNACAEVLFVLGDFSGAEPVLHAVLDRARCVEDKCRAYFTLVNSLGAQGDLAGAIRVGLDVLAELGEDFVAEADFTTISEDIICTKNVLEGTTIGRLARKEEMTDKKKIAAMKFLCLLSLYTQLGKQDLLELVSCRMVRLSLSHGLCKESAYGFALFGKILCFSLNDIRGGYRFGKLALSLIDRFKAKELIPHTYCVNYGATFLFVEPIQACIKKLSDGYEVGMMTGDIEWAAVSALLTISLALLHGNKLERLEQDGREKLKQMEQYKLLSVSSILRVLLQAIINLIGSPVDPTQLNGEFMNQEKILGHANTAQNRNAVYSTIFIRMWLAYLFEKYENAVDLMGQLEELSAFSGGHRIRGTIAIPETFLTCLIALAMERRGENRRKWRLVADSALQKLRGWEQDFSSWNFQHMVELVQAEIAFLDNDIDTAATLYDKAIHSAGKHGFVYEQALACERAGLFSLELDNKQTARDYFVRSRELYLVWGANRKAADVSKRLEDLDVA